MDGSPLRGGEVGVVNIGGSTSGKHGAIMGGKHWGINELDCVPSLRSGQAAALRLPRRALALLAGD